MKNDWIAKKISEKYHHWECYMNKNLFLELIAEKELSLWRISLKKYTVNSKLNITNHCHKDLKQAYFYKKLFLIFKEYF